MRAQLAAGLLFLMLAGCGGGGGGDDESGNPTGPNPSNPSNPNYPDPPDPGDPGDPGDPTDGASVAVNDNEYSPGSVTIKSGTSVVWTWTPGNYSAHSVTFTDNVGSSAAMATGTHSRTFPTAGTYAYQCSVHGTAMAGTVVVADP